MKSQKKNLMNLTLVKNQFYVDDSFNKLVQKYENAVYKFINDMLEVNYCNKIKKRHFKIKLIIIKKNNFKTGNKCHMCDI